MRQDAVLLDERSAEEFFLFLKEKSRTAGTIENYRHSLEELYDYLPEEDGGSGKYIGSGTLARWRGDLLQQGYAVRTVNARMSAVNKFLEYRNRRDLQVGAHVGGTGRDSARTVPGGISAALNVAKMTEQERTYFLLKTIATMGIRMDELQEITVEHLEKGRIDVGKAPRRGGRCGFRRCCGRNCWATRSGRASDQERCF